VLYIRFHLAYFICSIHNTNLKNHPPLSQDSNSSLYICVYIQSSESKNDCIYASLQLSVQSVSFYQTVMANITSKTHRTFGDLSSLNEDHQFEIGVSVSSTPKTHRTFGDLYSLVPLKEENQVIHPESEMNVFVNPAQDFPHQS
jgi:hypothetical protein